jgi:hypothetical protein
MIAFVLTFWACIGACSVVAGIFLHLRGQFWTRATWGIDPTPVPTEDSAEWDRLRAAVDGPDFVRWDREIGESA